MKKTLKTLLVAAAIFGTPGAALAEGDWAGLYMGVQISASDATASVGPASAGDKAGTYGLHIGYNHALENRPWVVGAELSHSTADYTIAGVSLDTDTTRLKLRAGIETGKSLIYGTLGYSQLEIGAVSDNGPLLGLGINYMLSDHVILGGELTRESFEANTVDFDVTTVTLGLSYKF